ncbi:MAG: hypothetical protein NVS2B14_16720 [Chamaesiphon sp.]
MGQVTLTAEQAAALGWAQSKQGKFARDLMHWNEGLLANMECEKQAERLGVTLQIQDKKARTGFCTLWVEPINNREFVQSKR